MRVLHSLSFVDDPTRMLRAVRFEQRFNFQIEGRTRQLMEEARPLLHQVTGDRLRHELDLALAEEKPAAMLARNDMFDVEANDGRSRLRQPAVFANVAGPAPDGDAGPEMPARSAPA